VTIIVSFGQPMTNPAAGAARAGIRFRSEKSQNLFKNNNL
jgi:hypothetical protein